MNRVSGNGSNELVLWMHAEIDTAKGLDSEIVLIVRSTSSIKEYAIHNKETGYSNNGPDNGQQAKENKPSVQTSWEKDCRANDSFKIATDLTIQCIDLEIPVRSTKFNYLMGVLTDVELLPKLL